MKRIGRTLSSERPRYPEKYSWWSPIIRKLVSKEDLSKDEVEEATFRILSLIERGDAAAPLLMAGFFGGLTFKGPTIDELAAMYSGMERTRLVRLSFNVSKPIVTAGGTGGDTIKTINVTTPAVLLAASAGAVAVKSGAKAFTSRTGATDLAMSMGINVYSNSKIVKSCVERLGTAVWASSIVYQWMEPLIELRNCKFAPILFPQLESLRLMIATSLNPFSTKRQVRGVSTPQTRLVAEVLGKIGYERALVPLGYGMDENVRIDEFSNLGKTVVSELHQNGEIDTYEVNCEDLGVKRGDVNEVVSGETHRQNALIILRILSGRDRTGRRDLIAINAGAILYLADEVDSIKEGYELASNTIDEGHAIRKVEELVKWSGGDLKKLSRLVRLAF
ncbi:MAG: hypothetical protein QXN62_05635 [Candidatus Bathyarchaeia archaeon]|nr:hypothetical protein [Candidatus Bathyarchaeota archaeon]